MILGGGASGLSLGILTGASIIEAGSNPGGHSRSTIVDGFTFDRGPHIMFSRSSFLLSCMVNSLGRNVHQCVRNNKVLLDSKLVKYPIENDLGSLGIDVASECLTGYVQAQIERARSIKPALNLSEWFEVNFGKALTDLYFRPYNEKVWKVKLEDLSMVWAERIPVPPVEDVIRSAIGLGTEGYLHQLYYHYPRLGGYSALMDAWAGGLSENQIMLSTKVHRIRDSRRGLLTETSGGVVESKKVVSTIPLGELPSIYREMPIEIESCINRLRTNATIVVTLAFSGIDTNKWTAVYISDKDFLPNRVSYPAVFSPENSPPDKFLVQAEIVIPTLTDMEQFDNSFLVNHVVTGLRKHGLIANDSELVNTFIERYELAYVVYTNGYESDLKKVNEWALSKGILLHGRFGSHSYLNVDGCLEQSINLARSLDFSISDSEIASKFKAIGEVE